MFLISAMLSVFYCNVSNPWVTTTCQLKLDGSTVGCASPSQGFHGNSTRTSRLNCINFIGSCWANVPNLL
jgi:hypothetical protein